MLSHSAIHRCHISWVEHSPPYSTSLEESNIPTKWTPCCSTLQSPYLQRSQLLGPGVEVWVNSGLSVTKWCGFGIGAIPPVNLTGTSP